MTRKLAAAAFIIAAGITAGCGASEPAPTTGCAPGQTEEIYVKTMYECPDGHSVYTFADNAGRDGYRKIAEAMGGHTLRFGDRWLKMDY